MLFMKLVLMPGMQAIEPAQRGRLLGAIAKRFTIVAYCRGPYCVLAVEAVERLSSWGYRALRLEDGVQEWRALGLSVETSVGD